MIEVGRSERVVDLDQRADRGRSGALSRRRSSAAPIVLGIAAIHERNERAGVDDQRQPSA
jgi:hypothetical protein